MLQEHAPFSQGIHAPPWHFMYGPRAGPEQQYP